MPHSHWGEKTFSCEFSLLASLCHQVQRSLTVKILGQQTTTSALNDTRLKLSYCNYMDYFVHLWKKVQDMTNKNPHCDIIQRIYGAEKLTTVMSACQKKEINQLERDTALTLHLLDKKKKERKHSWQSCRRLIGSVFSVMPYKYICTYIDFP